MIFKLSAATILGLVDGISSIVSEQKEDNKAYINAAPGVIPHKIFRILPHDFYVYLQHHQEHLEYTFSIEDIENIRRQHKALCDTYHRQTEVSISIDRFDDGDA